MAFCSMGRLLALPANIRLVTTTTLVHNDTELITTVKVLQYRPQLKYFSSFYTFYILVDYFTYGAMTFSIMTLSIMTLSIIHSA